MKKNTEEEGLTKINENSIFFKIKRFFRKVFHKKEVDHKVSSTEMYIDKPQEEKTKKSFLEDIRNIENEETKLLELQKQYHLGQILEKDLTDEQLIDLTNLYKKQNEEIRKSNAIREKRLLEYRRKLQTNN